MRRSSLILALSLLTTSGAFAQAGFDGTWRGTLTPAAGARTGCAAGGNRTITVQGGQAVMNVREGETAEGRVAADGSVTMIGGRNGNTRVTGRFEGNAFAGEYRTRDCSFSLELTKTR